MTPAKLRLAMAAMADLETNVGELAASSASRGRPSTDTSIPRVPCARMDGSCSSVAAGEAGRHRRLNRKKC